jgi:hypothetical protein
MPIVQARSADGLLGNIKPQRPDQMQPRSGSGTGAGNIAAVLRDFRLDQYDIQHLLTSYASQGKSCVLSPIVCQNPRKINPKNVFFSTFLSIHIKKGDSRLIL